MTTDIGQTMQQLVVRSPSIGENLSCEVCGVKFGNGPLPIIGPEIPRLEPAYVDIGDRVYCIPCAMGIVQPNPGSG